jgi:hypothetical protein
MVNIATGLSTLEPELEDVLRVLGASRIDILKKVKDKENRMEIANDMVLQFKKEKIKFDYKNFIDVLK